MDSQTRYRYEKRIKDLEARAQKAESELFDYRNFAMRVYDWLAPFAEAGKGSPNAAFGLDLMKKLFK